MLLLSLNGSFAASNAANGHNTVDCNTCHGASGQFAATQNPVVAETCRSCHASNVVPNGNDHQSADGRCLTCHSFHTPDQITTTVGIIDLAMAADRNSAHCQACHGSKGSLSALSAAHRVAASLYHENADVLQSVSPSEACLRCHSNTSSSPWQAATGGRDLTFNTHASHPYSVKVVPGRGDASNWIAAKIDARLPLFDGNMECQTCHLLTAGRKDLLIPFETKYDLCKGCHKHYGDDRPQNDQVRPTLANR